MHIAKGYASAEAAAQGDIPDRFCRVVASARCGDLAFVLLVTNEPPHEHIFGVRCRLRDELWYEEGGSSNGGTTWSSSVDDSDLGELTWSKEVPVGADRVRVRFMGAEHELEAQNGHCVFVAQNVPDTEWPTITSSRREGVWS